MAIHLERHSPSTRCRFALGLVILHVAALAQLAAADTVRRRLQGFGSERTLSWAAPNYTIYHTQADLLRKVEDIVKANPTFMKIETLTASDGNYQGELKVVTVEPGGFTDKQDQKVRMLMDFGEHGREFISAELGLLLLQTLAGQGPGGGSGALEGLFGSPGDKARADKLQQLLRGTVMKILPLENQGGRRLVESGKLCERKNGRGVDPNRNWPVDWGVKEKDYDPNEEFPGTAPFSEPEVKLLNELAKSFKPSVWLNVHSGMEAMFTPWDHKAEVAPEARDALAILQRIQADVMAGTSCVVGSGGKTVGYLAHGTATDYMFSVLGVPLSYTWEIYGDFDAHFNDCFRMFNPLDEKGVQAVLTRWLRAIMRLVELLPTHPALANSPAWALEAGTGPGADKQAQQQEQQKQKQAAGQGTGQQQGQGQGEGEGSSKAVGGQGGEQGQGGTAGGKTQSTGASGIGEEGPASGGGGGGAGTDAGAGQGSGTGDSEERVVVVGSRLGLGHSTPWAAGLLALGGLAAVGALSYRCLARGGQSGGGFPRPRGYNAV